MSPEIPYKVCADRDEALAFWEDQAKRLKRLGVTKRYGVYMKPLTTSYNGTWGVYLKDRLGPK